MGDSGFANRLNEEEVGEHVKLFVEMEDPESITDLLQES